MAWVRRGPHLYYSRYERSGEVVRRVNFGRGGVAELAANLDALDRLDRQAQARAWSNELARYEAADGLVDGLGKLAALMTEAALTRAGYHRHDRGSWRKKRRVMTGTNMTPAVEPMSPEDIREVLEAARRGDRSVLPVLQELLDAKPQIWRDMSALAAHSERAWLDLAAGPDLALAEALARKLAALKIELAGPTPSPVEKLIVDRVAATWVQTAYADAVVCRAKDRGLSLARLDHLQRRMERARRGFLAAVKALATVRKLLPGAPRPRAADGQECPVEALRREARSARSDAQEGRVDRAPGAGEKSTAKAARREHPGAATGDPASR